MLGTLIHNDSSDISTDIEKGKGKLVKHIESFYTLYNSSESFPSVIDQRIKMALSFAQWEDMCCTENCLKGKTIKSNVYTSKY